MAVNPTHTRLAATATRLISQNGRAAVLRSFTESGPSYNPVVTPINTPVTVVETNLERQDVDNTLVLATDKAFLLGSAVAPDDTGKLVDGDQEYDIVRSRVVVPGEVIILYKVYCRL